MRQPTNIAVAIKNISGANGRRYIPGMYAVIRANVKFDSPARIDLSDQAAGAIAPL